MNMKQRLGAAAAIAITATGLTVTPAHAGGLWDNCTNFNERYPHGVGKRHAHDQTSGDPVTNFVHSNRKYRKAMNHNPDLDRDRDRIACEQH